jgi:hypothetical protein
MAASVPLTILMVVYTALSLSVIAEPLVRFRTPDPSYSRLGLPLVLIRQVRVAHHHRRGP